MMTRIERNVFVLEFTYRLSTKTYYTDRLPRIQEIVATTTTLKRSVQCAVWDEGRSPLNQVQGRLQRAVLKVR